MRIAIEHLINLMALCVRRNMRVRVSRMNAEKKHMDVIATFTTIRSVQISLELVRDRHHESRSRG